MSREFSKFVKSMTIGVLLPLSLLLFSLPAYSASPERVQIGGRVVTGFSGLANSQVTLYQAGIAGAPVVELGSALSRTNGTFRITYQPPVEDNAVLYLIAEVSPEIKLATVLQARSGIHNVVINERSTVATAFAMAQFIDGDVISGNDPGLPNAASMAKNLVDIVNGRASTVLKNSPNGTETSAWADFNTLSNMIARCVNGLSDCAALFALSAVDNVQPTDTLQAMQNIAHYPANNVADLLAYAQVYPLYRPSLTSQDKTPDAWTLAVRFVDRRNALDGPGLVAFDSAGNAWVNNNYFNIPNPRWVCGDNHLFAFGPDGAELPGSPFGGQRRNGGLYGAGFGITVDRNDDIWVANFGFTGKQCIINGTDELINLESSVSQFDTTGQPISPSTPPQTPPYGGWRSDDANILKPQGIMSDSNGDIWTANCGNGTVTKLPDGSIDGASNYAPVDGNGDPLLVRPFGVTIAPDHRVWVASNNNATIVPFNPDGSVDLDDVVAGEPINQPMGVASDSNGNIWVANSGAVRPPCGTGQNDTMLSDEDAVAESPIDGASATVIMANGDLHTFTGGGIFMPWGIAVDGNNDVWVANFAGPHSGLVGLAHLCGVDSPSCPDGQFGDPLAPEKGYTSDGLQRITGVSIDPSGNVWAVNNWLRDINLDNPGGHQLVVFIGLAAPVKTPLIGSPRQP